MKINSHTIAALLLAMLLLPGCSMMTHAGRQQRAYDHYVRKSSLGRIKQQRRFRSNKPSMPVTEPIESSGPEAVAENVP
jgi:outer membrane biogenesis lipoprotein LolB